MERLGGIVLFSVPLLLNLFVNGKKKKNRVAVVGLTCLDIHACGVESIPEANNIHFINDIHLSVAGTAGREMRMILRTC